MHKRGDSKVESNDSPEIPDRGETSDIPGLPSGVGKVNTKTSPHNISKSAHSKVCSIAIKSLHVLQNPSKSWQNPPKYRNKHIEVFA